MRPPRTRALGDSRSGGPPRPTPAMADGRSEHRLSGDGAVFMDSAPGDADLVRDCLGGDRGAFDVLVQRYQKTVFNAAFRLVNSLEDAKDIAQGVFLKVYENLGSYVPKHKFYSWIYRITVNEALNARRSHRRMEPLEPVALNTPASQLAPDEAYALSELNQHVQRALMSLTPEYRTVVVLRHFMNCSYEDISEITVVPVKTVRSRLYTARQRLRDYFLERGLV